MNPRLTSDGPPGAPGWPAWPPTPDRTPLQRARRARPTRLPATGHTQLQRAPTNRNLAHRATPRRPTGGFAPLDASLQRVAGVSQP